MRLPRIIGAMVFVFAQASCLETCKTGCDLSASNASAIIDPGGNQRVHFKGDCSTCGHSDITTTWTYFGTPAPGGRVFVEVEFSCRNSGPRTYNVARSVQVPETRLDYHEVGVKNVCGEDTPVIFFASVSNQSDVPIEVTSTIACPTLTESVASPASPSRSGR